MYKNCQSANEITAFNYKSQCLNKKFNNKFYKCRTFKQIKKAVNYCLNFYAIGSVPSSLSTILISKFNASKIRIIVENLGVY